MIAANNVLQRNNPDQIVFEVKLLKLRRLSDQPVFYQKKNQWEEAVLIRQQYEARSLFLPRGEPTFCPNW